MTIDADLRARLPSLVDPAYLAQITRLVPGAKILGVRVPALRGLARELDRQHSLDDEAAIALLHRVAKRKVREEMLVGAFLIAQKKRRIAKVAWKDLDYLVVDMPPGTGDVALSLSQTVPAAGAIVVTTPQQVSLADSRRAVRMYQKLQIPTLGLVENMSFYE